MKNAEFGQIFTAVVISSVLNNITPDMILRKWGRSGIVTKISKEAKHRNYDISRYLRFKQYNDVFLRFQQILDTELSHCKINAFYKNIRSLTLDKKNIETNLNAIYNGDLNHITLFENSETEEYFKTKKGKEDSINHEVLHMATTYKKGNILFMGFMQSLSKEHYIGKGLNEGYTERLNLKYFAHNKKANVYCQQIAISEGIENIIGRKKMEQLYFAADLKGLVEELSNYCSKEQAIELIKKIDACHKLEQENEIKYIMLGGEIRVEIANIYANKQRSLLEQNQITKEEYENNVFQNCYLYMKSLRLEKTQDKKGYIAVDDEANRFIPNNMYEKIKQEFFSKNQGKINFESDEHIMTPGDVASTVDKMLDESISSRKVRNETEINRNLNEMFDSESPTTTINTTSKKSS